MRLSDVLKENDSVVVDPVKGIRLSEALSPEKADLENQYRLKTPFLFAPRGISTEGKSLSDVLAEEKQYAESPEYQAMQERYGEQFQAVAQGIFPLGPEEWRISAEKHPIAKAVGTVSGYVATGALTAGIGPLVSSAKQIAALPTMAKIAAGHMAQTGITFGIKELADDMAELSAGQKKDFNTVITDVLLQTGSGVVLGAAGSIASPIARIPAQAAYGYAAAKIQGADNMEAGTNAAIFAVFGLFNTKNLTESYKKAAASGATQALADRFIAKGIKPDRADLIAKRYMSYAISRNGGWAKAKIKDFDKFSAAMRKGWKTIVEPEIKPAEGIKPEAKEPVRPAGLLDGPEAKIKATEVPAIKPIETERKPAELSSATAISDAEPITLAVPEKKVTPIKPESIKPDVSGITPLQKEIQAMGDRLQRVDMAKSKLEQIDVLHDFLKKRITRYKEGYLKEGYLAEELKNIPSVYIKTKGGIKPDEAMEELRYQFGIDLNSETELVDFLSDIDRSRKDLIAEIEKDRPKFLLKKETKLLEDKIKAAQAGIKQGKIEAKQEVMDVQEELVDLLNAAKLEAKDKVKFISAIKNVQTSQQLDKALPKILKRITSLKEQAERSELISDLRDLFERQPTKGLPVEYKDMIEDIKEKVMLKKKTPAKRREIESMRSFVQRMEEQGEEINIPPEKLALLNVVSVDEMTTDQLKDLKETIERLYHLGKLKNVLLTAEKDRQFSEIVAEGVKNITKGKQVTSDSSFIKSLKEQNKDIAGMSIQGIKDYIAINMRPELMINILDDLEQGINTRVLFDTLWEAERNKFENMDKVIESIKNIHKNIDLKDAVSKKYDVGRFKGITKNNALHVYANSFEYSNKLHLLGSGLTEEDIAAISNSLTDKEKKAVQDMINYFYPVQYENIDKVYSELEGVHLGRFKSYFPIDRVEDISYNKELEKDIMERNYIQKAGVSKGFAKEREMSTKGLSEFSYFDTIMRNVGKVYHYVSYAKAIRDVNKYLGSPEIKNAIKTTYGEKYYSVLEKWLKDVSYGGSRQEHDLLNNLSKWIRTNYITYALGLNMSAVAKAPVSFLQGMEMAGKEETLKALAQFIQNPFETIKFVENKSPFVKFRYFTQEREFRDLLNQRSAIQRMSDLSLYQWIREKSTLPYQIADKTTVSIVWLGDYKKSLSQGLSEKDAKLSADRAVRRTQPMGGILHLPEAFRGSEVQKLFTLFRNQPNQNFNLILESIMKKQGNKENWGKFANEIMFYLIFPAFLIGLISRKRLQEDPGEFAKDVLNSATGGLIYWGNISASLASGFFGDISPLESLIKDMGSLIGAKRMETRINKTLDIAGKITGLPIIGAKRLFTGELMGKQAKTKNKTSKKKDNDEAIKRFLKKNVSK